MAPTKATNWTKHRAAVRSQEGSFFFFRNTIWIKLRIVFVGILDTVNVESLYKDHFQGSPYCRLIFMIPWFGLQRGQHHVGSMVALLAVEVASVARVTCRVLGREFASSFFWIQQLGHRSMRGTLNVFCLFWWPTSCYLLSGHGCTDWTQFMLKSPQAGQNFLKIGGGFMECFQKTRVINRWRDVFFFPRQFQLIVVWIFSHES